jgi:hypothetical protein
MELQFQESDPSKASQCVKIYDQKGEGEGHQYFIVC